MDDVVVVILIAADVFAKNRLDPLRGERPDSQDSGGFTTPSDSWLKRASKVSRDIFANRDSGHSSIVFFKIAAGISRERRSEIECFLPIEVMALATST